MDGQLLLYAKERAKAQTVPRLSALAPELLFEPESEGNDEWKSTPSLARTMSRRPQVPRLLSPLIPSVIPPVNAGRSSRRRTYAPRTWGYAAVTGGRAAAAGVGTAAAAVAAPADDPPSIRSTLRAPRKRALRTGRS